VLPDRGRAVENLLDGVGGAGDVPNPDPVPVGPVAIVPLGRGNGAVVLETWVAVAKLEGAVTPPAPVPVRPGPVVAFDSGKGAVEKPGEETDIPGAVPTPVPDPIVPENEVELEIGKGAEVPGAVPLSEAGTVAEGAVPTIVLNGTVPVAAALNVELERGNGAVLLVAMGTVVTPVSERDLVWLGAVPVGPKTDVEFDNG